MGTAAVERWSLYRDNPNNTAHDYGVGFVEDTLKLLPMFVDDAGDLETLLREKGSADARSASGMAGDSAVPYCRPHS